ncbi:MAG: ABC transporter ATP-binding protein [SAR324 cluster bacterium]|nr:ABC transporter ATP-binding protein [SAR324 cluster bacterium]
MDTPAVIVDQVSKKYKIFSSNRFRFLEFFHPFNKKYHQEFWALRDISFQIPSGQTYGLIGRNGSGKSTLLQIIAGVLQPTGGSVAIHGRISALLELGAGFNPNFTGRDNVILSGVISGLSKEEIEEKLPSIIEFSELGEFVEQPVRTYSSGMYVRLAFSAAIHVDPDILIVDEALAVGDVRFQRKCFRKFEQFRKEGKTIFLVTHDTNAIVRHCDSAILMEEGKMINMGSAKDIVNHYVELVNTPDPSALASSTQKSEGKTEEFSHIGYEPASAESESTPLAIFLSEKPVGDCCPQRKSYNHHEHRYGTKKAEILDYYLTCQDEFDPVVITSNEPLDIYAKVFFHETVDFPIYGLTVKRLDGVEIYGSNSWFEEASVKPAQTGTVVIFKMSLPMNLVQGDYFFSLGIAEKQENLEIVALDRRYDLFHLKIHQTGRVFGIVDLDADFFEYRTLG